MKDVLSTEHKVLLIDTQILSNLFRITHITEESAEDGSYIYKAKLYSTTQSLTVTWLSENEREDLCHGTIVRGQWFTKKLFAVGTNLIKSLHAVTQLSKDECLTSTVPPDWVHENFAYWTFFQFVNHLPREYQRLVVKVLMEEQVLHHFIQAPHNLDDGFNYLGGNLQRTSASLILISTGSFKNDYNLTPDLLITTAILNCIGHYNDYFYDGSKYYSHTDENEKYDNKVIAEDLVRKAASTLRNFDNAILLKITRAIQDVDFNF